jgi:hypothetical protein
MKRKIKVADGIIYHLWRRFFPDYRVITYFNLKDGKYEIDLKEGKDFSFYVSFLRNQTYYRLFSYKNNVEKKLNLLICVKDFKKLFFEVDTNKKYDIIIKKL